MTDQPTTRDGFAEPFLLEVLASGGLDAAYVRAEGNTLYRRGEDGEEIAVLDFVGGYGSLMLGHNNPEINDRARELLDRQTPVHAQFSRHPYADELAAELNRIVQRERGDDESYYAIFANSGAEAVEAAMKHAELDRGLRLSALTEEIDAHLEEVRARVADGTATVPPRVAGSADELIADVRRRNEEQLARGPLFLTPEGAFHGKLAGSVQLTHNPGYRLPFKSLAAQARFVPRDQPGRCARSSTRSGRTCSTWSWRAAGYRSSSGTTRCSRPSSWSPSRVRAASTSCPPSSWRRSRRSVPRPGSRSSSTRSRAAWDAPAASWRPPGWG